MTHHSTIPFMKRFLLLIPLLAATALAATPQRTCRVLFLEAPGDAPEKLQLFDGKESREVELSRMNFSPVYKLPPGPLQLWLLPTPLTDRSNVPPGAPTVTISETMVDFYLLVSSDPANTVAPVRMQVINVGEDRLKRGQMLWFNLSRNTVGGTLGSVKLSLAPNARAVTDAPVEGNRDYPIKLGFLMPDNPQVYPLCETRWRHDPMSRNLAFVIPKEGSRSPRVVTFSDYREPPREKP